MNTPLIPHRVPSRIATPLLPLVSFLPHRLNRQPVVVRGLGWLLSQID